MGAAERIEVICHNGKRGRKENKSVPKLVPELFLVTCNTPFFEMTEGGGNSRSITKGRKPCNGCWSAKRKMPHFGEITKKQKGGGSGRCRGI